MSAKPQPRPSSPAPESLPRGESRPQRRRAQAGSRPANGQAAEPSPPRKAAPGGRAPLRRPAAALPRPAEEKPLVPAPAKPRRRPSRKAEPSLKLEAVFYFLYDVGRAVDLKKVAALVPAHDDLGIVKRRDTPASLSLPRPLILQLGESECVEAGDFECFSAQAKVYEEGALSILVRVKTELPFAEWRSLRERTVLTGGRPLTIPSYAEESFRKLLAAIRPAITEANDEAACDRESYTAYCLLEAPGEPEEFIASHRESAAAFLIGEDPSVELHPGQIASTLGKPFSYRRGDLAVFDLDRCLIIDPSRDYEDLLLIIEHANYQLLELRVLDKLLDKWLDVAEKDMRTMYAGGKRRKAKGTPQVKFARIQSLRFDALFILENLENSSKIIGDYYLGQIYDRLCSIFNTEGWKWSVERRLDTLQDIYDMVKTDSSERKILVLEVVFIVVCTVFPILQIAQLFILG